MKSSLSKRAQANAGRSHGASVFSSSQADLQKMKARALRSSVSSSSAKVDDPRDAFGFFPLPKEKDKGFVVSWPQL